MWTVQRCHITSDIKDIFTGTRRPSISTHPRGDGTTPGKPPNGAEIPLRFDEAQGTPGWTQATLTP